MLFWVHASVILRWRSCWRHCTSAGPVQPVSAILSGFPGLVVGVGADDIVDIYAVYLQLGESPGASVLPSWSGESLVGLVDDRTGCGELLVAFAGSIGGGARGGRRGCARG